MSIPVVFLHLGAESPVLEKVINQAKKQNEVILIGDQSTLHLKELCGIGFVDVQQVIDEDFVSFDKLYDHLSTNPEFIEKFCFLRWFALRTMMERANIDRVFYADSDVMLYCNVTEENKKFEQFGMTLAHRCCGSTSFMSKKTLNDFCNYLIGIYKNKEGFEYHELLNKFSNMRNYNKHGGVCDMTLLDKFHYAQDIGGGPCIVGEMTQVINNETYDHNLNCDEGVYDSDARGAKNIVWGEDGNPYCYHQLLKKQVKFNALHYQGPAKVLLQ